jgi:chromosome segregation ATPase
MATATLERTEALLHHDSEKNAIVLAAIDESAENVRMEVKAAQDGNSKVLNALRTDFTELRADFTGLRAFVEGSLTRLDERVGKLDGRFDKLDGRVGKLETGLADVRSEMADGFKSIIDLLPPKK